MVSASVGDNMETARRSAFSGLKADYIVATSASFSIAVVGLFLYGWIGRAFDPESLGHFSQIRRVSTMWVPLASVCLSVALGRYVPRLADPLVIRRRSLQAIGTVSLVLLVHVIAFEPLARAGILRPVIGVQTNLVAPFLWQLLGLGLLVIPFALLRGLQRFRWAAVLQVTGYALWPLGVALYSSDGPLGVLIERIGQGQVAFAVFALLILMISPTPAAAPRDPKDEGFRSWLVYSSVRLPAGLLGFVLWAGLPMILSSWGALEEAGLANAVTSLANIPLMILSPLAFVLLPRLSLAQIDGQHEEVNEFLARGVRSIWELQWPVTLTLLLFLDPILDLWLGFSLPSFERAGLWMVGSIPGVAIFMFLRPALNARAVIPYAVFAHLLGLILAAVIVTLATPTQSISMLGLAFFGAHTAAACVAGWACLRIHDLVFRPPLSRLLVQSLPLTLGMLVVLRMDVNSLSIVIWSAAILIHLVILHRTGSPVTSGLVRMMTRKMS